MNPRVLQDCDAAGACGFAHAGKQAFYGDFPLLMRFKLTMDGAYFAARDIPEFDDKSRRGRRTIGKHQGAGCVGIFEEEGRNQNHGSPVLCPTGSFAALLTDGLGRVMIDTNGSPLGTKRAGHQANQEKDNGTCGTRGGGFTSATSDLKV